MQPSPETDTAASELVGQIQARARELGLTWQLVKATVTAYDASTGAVMAVLDGDTVPIGVISMVGGVAADARVWVMVVPPGGNYLVGMVGQPSGYRARRTLTADAASVTFSAIPSNLRRLTVRWTARSSDVGSGIQAMRLRVNGDSSANYGNEFVQGSGAAVGAALLAGQTSFFVGNHTNASAAAGFFGAGIVDLNGWDEPTPFLNILARSGAFAAGGNYITAMGFLNVAGPYTSLTFFSAAGNLVTGSDFQLEGEFT